MRISFHLPHLEFIRLPEFEHSYFTNSDTFLPEYVFEYCFFSNLSVLYFWNYGLNVCWAFLHYPFYPFFIFPTPSLCCILGNFFHCTKSLLQPSLRILFFILSYFLSIASFFKHSYFVSCI